MTICITENAAWQVLLPYVVYKGTHLYSSLCQGGLERTHFAMEKIQKTLFHKPLPKRIRSVLRPDITQDFRISIRIVFIAK